MFFVVVCVFHGTFFVVVVIFLPLVGISGGFKLVLKTLRSGFLSFGDMHRKLGFWRENMPDY